MLHDHQGGNAAIWADVGVDHIASYGGLSWRASDYVSAYADAYIGMYRANRWHIDYGAEGGIRIRW